ncbi:DsrE family protein [Halopseudomonas sp.]|uniref:DsrE family protein n=1 Tax=Halopseudomonas sp. TaxID=2901191 RepID=UPI0030035FB9
MLKINGISKLSLFLGGMLLLAHMLVSASEKSRDNGQTSAGVVIQVTTDDTGLQNMLFSNIRNLQHEMGASSLTIEVVAYGPGLGLLTTESKLRAQVEELSATVRFSACENTIAAVAKRTGHRPELIDGVVTVPSGIARVVQLQQQGYVYITPQ